MSKTFLEFVKSDPIEKFNPYHDRLGRFTFAGAAGGYGVSSSQFTGDKERQAVTFSANPDTVSGYNAIMRHQGVMPTAYSINGKNPPEKPNKPDNPKEKPDKPNEQRPRKGLEAGLGEKHAQAMEDKINKGPENIKKVWEKYGDEIEVKSANWSGTAQCDYHGKIYVNIESSSKHGMFKTAYETPMHESGHSIDRAIARKTGDMYFSERYKNGLFSKTLKDEAQRHIDNKVKELNNDTAFKESHPYSYKKNGTVKIDVARAELSKELSKGGSKATGDVSDMFEGATKGKVTGSAGHGKSYWDYHDVSVEAFAEMFSASTTNPDSLASIKKYFPDSYKVFNEMMDYAGNL